MGGGTRICTGEAGVQGIAPVLWQCFDTVLHHAVLYCTFLHYTMLHFYHRTVLATML
jgi:hypothetical protein